ncbi:MAG TPA: hypothetical protein VL461_00590 [Dictyobacter sp.]|jgi:hypothetical protein|nr:hypothetical protein [Dictyobacter sp.]
MTTYQTPLVVGVFNDEDHAKSAVETLRGAGFRYDQLGVAIQGSSNATPDLSVDLMNLGVPQEQAHYYDKEYKSGNIVVSVRPDGRDGEVQDILQGNGAYDFNEQAQSPERNATQETTGTQSEVSDEVAQTSESEVTPDSTR